MTRIETILNGLEGNARDFKMSCETKICSANLLENLEVGLNRGRKLDRDITEVLAHLADLKARLNHEEFEG